MLGANVGSAHWGAQQQQQQQSPPPIGPSPTSEQLYEQARQAGVAMAANGTGLTPYGAAAAPGGGMASRGHHPAQVKTNFSPPRRDAAAASSGAMYSTGASAAPAPAPAPLPVPSPSKGKKKSKWKSAGDTVKAGVQVGGEVKRKRLRKRELKRLLKMQECARRWLSRRRSKEKDAHSHVLFRTILDELLMQDVMPNILVDVVVRNAFEFAPPPGYDADMQRAYDVMEDEAVKVVARSLAREAVGEVLDDFLRQHEKPESSPANAAADVVVDEAIAPFVRDAVREVIRERVADLLESRKAGDEGTVLLDEALREATRDCAVDAVAEALLDEALGAVTGAEASDVAHEAVPGAQARAAELREAREARCIADTAKAVVLRSCALRQLSASLAGRGSGALLGDALADTLRGIMAGTLAAKARAAEARRRAVGHDGPLRKVRDQVMVRAGLDVLLGMLADLGD